MISLLYSIADRLRRPRRPFGAQGEDRAHRFLRQRKFTVVARNYRPRMGPGEIDLIAWDGPTLVFIEVKTRATDAFGAPDRALDAEKRLHLQRAAREYARRADVDWSRVRFDVVTVLGTYDPQIKLIRDAFGTPSQL
ncbi:MAG: YraN family protein [Acidobacteriota bacterium]|nr:YraN family protein [Acidobacteriota bacterium]